MVRKTYFITTSFLFLILFIVHFIRLIQGWEILIDGVIIPMWLSWIAVVLTGTLATFGWRFYKGHK